MSAKLQSQSTCEPAVPFEFPRVTAKSDPMPSLTHLCSYASSHTRESTCQLRAGDDRRHPSVNDEAHLVPLAGGEE